MYLHIACIWRGAVHRLSRRARLARDLGHEPILKVAEASALFELVLGQEQIPKP